MQCHAEVSQFTHRRLIYASIQTCYLGKYFWFMVYKKGSQIFMKKTNYCSNTTKKKIYFLKPDQGRVKYYW